MRLRFLIGCALLLATPAPARATTRIWAGAVDSRWSTAGNWSNGSPSPGDELLFPRGAATTTSTNDYPPGTTFGPISFADAYTVGGNQITLTGALSTAGGTTTIGFPVKVGSPQTWTVNWDAPLVVNEAVDLNGNDLTVASLASNFNGPNGVLPGQATLNGPIIGTGNLRKTGQGAVTITGTSTFQGSMITEGYALTIDGASVPVPIVVKGLLALLHGATVGDVTCDGVLFTNSTANVGNLTFGPSSSLQMRLGSAAGTIDTELRVAGRIDLNGAELILDSQVALIDGTKIVLIENDGTDPLAGAFLGRSEDDTVDSLGFQQKFRITYAGGTGNDVVLTAVLGTTTTINSSDNPVMAGKPVTFEATVRSQSSATRVPKGSISFVDGQTTIAIVGLDATGKARVTTSSLAAGRHSIIAYYLPSSGDSGSASPPLIETIAATRRRAAKH